MNLNRKTLIKLIQTKNMMEYTPDAVKESASCEQFSVCDGHADEPCEFTALMSDYENHASLPASESNEDPKIIDLTAEINEDDCDDTIKVPKEKMSSSTEVPKIYQRSTTVPKRKIAGFTLPPDYDPADSKWTLRYRHPVPGLIELMPFSGIYVSTTNLLKCHEHAGDCRSLIRLLMMEVFSNSALKVCSLTGAKPRCVEETAVRPGLDKYARDVLVSYVIIYGLKNGWHIDKPQAIASSMYRKLHNIRIRKKNF